MNGPQVSIDRTALSQAESAATLVSMTSQPSKATNTAVMTARPKLF